MPHRPRRLDLCDAIGSGIEMVRGAPLPDSLPCRSQLGEIRRIHLAGLGLRLGKILARSHLGFVHPSFDTLSNFVGYSPMQSSSTLPLRSRTPSWCWPG